MSILLIRLRLGRTAGDDAVAKDVLAQRITRACVIGRMPAIRSCANDDEITSALGQADVVLLDPGRTPCCNEVLRHALEQPRMTFLEIHDDAGSREADVPLPGDAVAHVHVHGHASQGYVLGLDMRSRSWPACTAAILGMSGHEPCCGAGNVMLRIPAAEAAAERIATARWCPSGRPAR